VILTELKGAPFLPALNDHLGAFRALAVLMPKQTRIKFKAAEEKRSTAEIARFVKLPEVYVETWLQFGDELEKILMPKRLVSSLKAGC